MEGMGELEESLFEVFTRYATRWKLTYEKRLDRNVRRCFKRSVELNEEDEAKLILIKEKHLEEMEEVIKQLFVKVYDRDDFQMTLRDIQELKQDSSDDLDVVVNRTYDIRVGQLARLKEFDMKLDEKSEEVVDDHQVAKSNFESAKSRHVATINKINEVRSVKYVCTICV